MNKKLLLVIDWSGLMYRSLALNALYGLTGRGTNYDAPEEVKSFVYKFATDICAILNIFQPNKILIAADSPKPWRKEIDLGEVGYKGTRHREGSYNWKNIYKGSDDLSEMFQKAGCQIAKIEHGEADDMACLVKETVFEKYHDYNIIIVSADADLRQLVDFNKLTNQYCLVYNTIAKPKTGKRMLYGTQDFIDWLNTEDSCDIFFSNIDMARQSLQNIIKKHQFIEVAADNPNDIVINKIFGGDESDNIPSFYSWYTNARQFKISPLKTKKICENADIHNVYDLIEVAKKGMLKHVIETVINRKIEDIDINERLDRQRHLVELNSVLFPEHIQNYKADIEMLLSEGEQLLYPMKANNILAGSDYAGASKRKAVEAEIFKQLGVYANTTLNGTPLF